MQIVFHGLFFLQKRAGIHDSIFFMHPSFNIGKRNRHPGAGIEMPGILELKVDMGLRGVPGVAASGNDIASFDPLPGLYGDALGHQMTEGAVFAGGMLEDDPVSADVRGIRVSLPMIHDAAVREAVFYGNDDSVSRGKDFFSVAVIAGQVLPVPAEAAAFVICYEKTIGITLGKDIPGMGGVLSNAAVAHIPFSVKRQGVKNLGCVRKEV